MIVQQWKLYPSYRYKKWPSKTKFKRLKLRFWYISNFSSFWIYKILTANLCLLFSRLNIQFGEEISVVLNTHWNIIFLFCYMLYVETIQIQIPHFVYNQISSPISNAVPDNAFEKALMRNTDPVVPSLKHISSLQNLLLLH